MGTFTAIHVLISLIAIISGFAVIYGLLNAKSLDSWTLLFLFMTAATSVTGFFLPFHGLSPAIVVGMFSLIVIAAAIFARYVRRLGGIWRKIYVIAALLALYLNVFVLVAQSFQNVPALNALAPTQSEAPFLIAQLAVLLSFVALTGVALKRFREKSAQAAGAGRR